MTLQSRVNRKGKVPCKECGALPSGASPRRVLGAETNYARGGDQLASSAASRRACSADANSSARMQHELFDSPAEPVCIAAGRSPAKCTLRILSIILESRTRQNCYVFILYLFWSLFCSSSLVSLPHETT